MRDRSFSLSESLLSPLSDSAASASSPGWIPRLCISDTVRSIVLTSPAFTSRLAEVSVSTGESSVRVLHIISADLAPSQYSPESPPKARNTVFASLVKFVTSKKGVADGGMTLDSAPSVRTVCCSGTISKAGEPFWASSLTSE